MPHCIAKGMLERTVHNGSCTVQFCHVTRFHSCCYCTALTCRFEARYVIFGGLSHVNLRLIEIYASLLNVMLLLDKLTKERVTHVIKHIIHLQEFVTQLNTMNLNNKEYAFLKVLALFSPGKIFNMTPYCIHAALETYDIHFLGKC